MNRIKNFYDSNMVENENEEKEFNFKGITYSAENDISPSHAVSISDLKCLFDYYKEYSPEWQTAAIFFDMFHISANDFLKGTTSGNCGKLKVGSGTNTIDVEVANEGGNYYVNVKDFKILVGKFKDLINDRIAKEMNEKFEGLNFSIIEYQVISQYIINEMDKILEAANKRNIDYDN